MDREVASSVVRSLHKNYPDYYKNYSQDEFKELRDRIYKAFERYPNDMVTKAYDDWFIQHSGVPTISKIIVVLNAKMPPKTDRTNPATWEHYEDEKGYEVVIPPPDWAGWRIGKEKKKSED